MTPELAHQIAKELADRVLGGQYEYVIGTHLNTGHIHSHIVWNSVSCVDGKKYRSNYKSYVTEIRAVSDELCRKYKLSVIDTENSNHVAKPYAEWLAEKNNQPTWRTAIRQDVDDAIRQSLTWRQFVAALQNKGYELQFNRKYPVLRPPGKERFVRFKTLGKRYTAEVIQNRLLYPQFDRCFVENSPRVQYGRLHSGKKSRRKLTGLRALYYRYLYELGALPRKPSRSSYAVRQDAYKLDQQSGRDLMTPDEVRLLDNSKCILFIRGERPVVDLKYNLLKHPNIRYTEDGGAAPYDYASADNARDDLPCAPENYELLDMDDFLPAEAAEMKPTIQRIRRPK